MKISLKTRVVYFFAYNAFKLARSARRFADKADQFSDWVAMSVYKDR